MLLFQRIYIFFHKNEQFHAETLKKKRKLQDVLIVVCNFYPNRDSDGERAYKVLEENGQLLEDKKVMVEALQIMKTGDYKAPESRMSTEAVSGNFFITYTGVHVHVYVNGYKTWQLCMCIYSLYYVYVYIK